MSFVLPGLLWWRQLKQTHSPSGTGVINCHMWANKGAILKPFVVFVNVFHLSLKRPNDFVVSWCMWLVALQNERNSSHLDFSIHFPLFLKLSFDGNAFSVVIELCFTWANVAFSLPSCSCEIFCLQNYLSPNHLENQNIKAVFSYVKKKVFWTWHIFFITVCKYWNWLK